MQAQIDAIMANISSTPNPFQGPPQPPAAWQVALNRLAPVVFVALVAVWSYGALYFYQRAVAIGVCIAQEEAANPLLLSSLRGPGNDEPGKTYAVATFLAIQVVAVIGGTAWQWYTVRRAARQATPASVQTP